MPIRLYVKSAWKRDETGNLKGAAAWFSQIIAVDLYFQSFRLLRVVQWIKKKTISRFIKSKEPQQNPFQSRSLKFPMTNI